MATAKKTSVKKVVAKTAPAKKTTAAKKTVAEKKPVAKKPSATAVKMAKEIGKKKVDPKHKGMSAKDIATDRGEPWVNVIQVELDPDNIGAGAFELDWNDKFLTKLIRAGYQKESNEKDTVIVDRWFQDVCRNIVMENFEQWEAGQTDPEMRTIIRRDLGNGKTEVS